MFIIIDIYSKNFYALSSFLSIFLSNKICNKLKLIIVKSSLQKTKKKKKLTKLKKTKNNKKTKKKFLLHKY